MGGGGWVVVVEADFSVKLEPQAEQQAGAELCQAQLSLKLASLTA